MRHWDTGDKATNANLAHLDSIARDDRPPFDAEQTFQKFVSVIEATNMLPGAVMAHFDLPTLFIGDGSHRWSANTRAERVVELCAALSAGLEKVAADDSLKEGGGANLADRPRTKGEEVEAALEAFEAVFPHDAYDSQLAALERAVASTRMARDVAEVRRIVSRKRWTGASTPESEVYRHLRAIDFYAGRYHHRPAGLF